MIFLNPWGFLALLGIPLVFYIHMLQRNSRKVPTSTMFLLDVSIVEKKAGRKLEKLRNSLLLWLNILAILILTFLLTQPQSNQSKIIFRAAVVVDSSFSMQPFMQEGNKVLFEEINKLAEKASGVELTIMSSNLEEKTIYHGSDLLKAQKALAEFIPNNSGHDLVPALSRAMTMLNSEGLVILLSDHKQEVNSSVLQVLCGTKINNVGFAGFIAKNEGIWRASIKNYGDKDVEIEWWAGTEKNPKQLNKKKFIAAGGIETIEGSFFLNEPTLVLEVADDKFMLDNKICAIRPQPKELTVRYGGVFADTKKFLDKLFNTLPRIMLTDSKEDFFIGEFENNIPVDKPGIYWRGSSSALDPKSEVKLTNGAFAMADELMEGLVWENVYFPVSPTMPVIKFNEFKPLLKLNELNLIEFRETGKGPQLLLNFDLNSRVFHDSSALIILMYRVIEKIRLYKKNYYQANYECNTNFFDPSLSGLKVVTDNAKELGFGRFITPSYPTFFELNQIIFDKPVLLFKGAAHFADAGEADFTKAVSLNQLSNQKVDLIEINHENDFLKPLWLILLLVICVYGWVLLDKKENIKNQGFKQAL